MSIAVEPISECLPPPTMVMRKFSEAEYHYMIEAGVFTEGAPFELLDG